MCWRWEIPIEVEWATMGTFCGKSMGGRIDRDRKPNLVGGGGGGRGRDRKLNFVACSA